MRHRFPTGCSHNPVGNHLRLPSRAGRNRNNSGTIVLQSNHILKFPALCDSRRVWREFEQRWYLFSCSQNYTQAKIRLFELLRKPQLRLIRFPVQLTQYYCNSSLGRTGHRRLPPLVLTCERNHTRDNRTEKIG